MLTDNLKLLLQLYVRPRAAMGAIVDEGSLLFGAAAVLVTAILWQVPTTAMFLKGAMALAHPPRATHAKPTVPAAEASPQGEPPRSEGGKSPSSAAPEESMEGSPHFDP